MNPLGLQKGRIFVAMGSLLAAACLAAPSHAIAQGKNPLVGTWTNPVSESYGASPRGLLIFTADGRYQLSIQRASLPKFASGVRTKGTAQEEHAVVEGSINHFGRYTVDTKKKMLTFVVEGSTFPNWIDEKQERPYEVKGGKLVYKVPVVSGTGKPGETGWSRAK